MTRALGPRASVTAGAGTPWLVLGGCWALIVAALLGWAGAKMAAWLSGGTAVSFGTSFMGDLLRGRFGQAWPRTPTVAVIGCTATVYTLVIALAVVAWRRIAGRLSRPGDPVAALAVNPALQALTREPVAERAVQLRSSLDGRVPKDIGPDDIGLMLGTVTRPGRGGDGEAGHAAGPAVFAGWEDTLVAFMAPRSGKTTALGIPFVLSAPGAVIATSNKADLWAATAELRAKTGSGIWLFDPQAVTHQPQGFWWNPLLGLDAVEDADRLAGHFVLTVADDKKRDLWGPAAQDLLAALFLAAAACGGSLHDVGRWLAEPAVPTPVEVLAGAGFGAMAMALRGAQNGAVETRDGIYQTARTAARCLSDPGIMAWVTPPGGRLLPCFGPDDFAASRDTLYLQSKSRSAAAPLIAALTDTAMRAAERRAERLGGRNEPPVVAVMDEAANICRISDLPELYSHLGSRGITPVTILQSYEQGVTVWGEHGMAALWGAATVKLTGAGVDSPRLARDLATLVGQHDVPVRSVTYGSDGRPSESVSLRRQDILEPAAVRALPKGTGLLLATGIKPALLTFTPWFQGPRAAGITACRDAAEAKIRDGARTRWEGAA